MIADNFVASIYNNRTGMMSSEANAIAQTEDGFIWIGSYAGLTKYDGTGFEFIKESGIASVICMLTDKKGRLWIGTNDGGVIRYEKGDFTQFTMADGLPTNSIRAFATDTKGNVYVATTDKLCKFDEADQIEILSVPITYVESIVCDKDRLVAVSNSGDIYALKEDKLLKLEENTFFNCVQVTSKGLMAGTSGQGVYLLEIDDRSQDTTGQTAVNHETAGQSIQNKGWIRNDLVKFHDPVQNLRTDHTCNHINNCQVKETVRIHIISFCTLHQKHDRENHAKGDHRSITVNINASNCKKNTTHNFTS